MVILILSWIWISLSIIVVDLSLSVDTSIAISIVVSLVPKRLKGMIFLLSSSLAVMFRVIFAILALTFFKFPFVKASIGFIILFGAYRLIRDVFFEDEPNNNHKRIRFRNGVTFSKLTSLLVVTYLGSTLDNTVTVATLAPNPIVLSISLFISAIMLFTISRFVSRIVERFPIIFYITAGEVTWVATGIIMSDKSISNLLIMNTFHTWIIYAIRISVLLIYITLASIVWNIGRRRYSSNMRISSRK